MVLDGHETWAAVERLLQASVPSPEGIEGEAWSAPKTSECGRVSLLNRRVGLRLEKVLMLFIEGARPGGRWRRRGQKGGGRPRCSHSEGARSVAPRAIDPITDK